MSVLKKNGKNVLALPNMQNAAARLGKNPAHGGNAHEAMKDQMFGSGNTDLKHFLARSEAALKARNASKPGGASFETQYSGSSRFGSYGEGMCGGVEAFSFKEQMMPRSMSRVQQKLARHMMINEMQ